jgi:hypothetical protein
MTDNLLKEEKHTNNAIAFAVNLDSQRNNHHDEPQIKKRLEASSEPAPITLEQIREKLERAEEKRRL